MPWTMSGVLFVEDHTTGIENRFCIQNNEGTGGSSDVVEVHGDDGGDDDDDDDVIIIL